MKIINKNFICVKIYGITLLLILLLSGCSSLSEWIPSSGPSRKQVETIVDEKLAATTIPIPVIDIDSAITQRAAETQLHLSFAQMLGDKAPPSYRINPGDILQVFIWEAPPSVLFGTLSSGTSGLPGTGNSIAFPDQIVDAQGQIEVPFAGVIRVAGRYLQQVEADITKRLTRKANQPQVMVRLARNVTSIVTIVGEVRNSTIMPLTPKGERLLDAIATAGGVNQPINKTTVQISRNGKVLSMPLNSVIQDSKQNIWLQPGDVVTALFQSNSFTVLGATGKNDEIPFEAQGISLTQALARAGGINDQRGDAQGVFIFRFEDPRVITESVNKKLLTNDGKQPTVYRVNLKDPRSFLIAQQFPIKNGDVLYVSNAQAAELQKFLNILTSSVFTVTNLINLSK
jgi:polysaccharide export outer membrane protein